MAGLAENRALTSEQDEKRREEGIRKVVSYLMGLCPSLTETGIREWINGIKEQAEVVQFEEKRMAGNAVARRRVRNAAKAMLEALQDPALSRSELPQMDRDRFERETKDLSELGEHPRLLYHAIDDKGQTRAIWKKPDKKGTGPHPIPFAVVYLHIMAKRMLDRCGETPVTGPNGNTAVLGAHLCSAVGFSLGRTPSGRKRTSEYAVRLVCSEEEAIRHDGLDVVLLN